MKKILYVGVCLNCEDSLISEIRLFYLDNLYFDITDNISNTLTKLRTSDVSCLLFDDINLRGEQIFSREETNNDRTTVLVLIKLLSQNKKFDPKKIVVKIGYTGEYFGYKKELISYGVPAENIFEKLASNKKVAEAVVKVLNNQ